jgi:hypothetical protein
LKHLLKEQPQLKNLLLKLLKQNVAEQNHVKVLQENLKSYTKGLMWQEV